MPTMKFEEHEIKFIEEQASKYNGNLPWILDTNRSQITDKGSVIYSYNCQISDYICIEAQANGGSVFDLYGFSLRGEKKDIIEILAMVYRKTQDLRKLEKEVLHHEATHNLEGESNDNQQ